MNGQNKLREKKMNESAVSAVPGTQSPETTLRSLDDLPGPRGLPLLGNALDLKPRELHRLLGRWADEFGPLFVFRAATTRIVTIVDADIIQHILRDRPDRFRRWQRMEDLANDIKADGLFTAEGEKWRRQRKFVMHALNAGHVREFIPRLEKVIGRLRRRWWRHALTSTTFDAHRDLMRLTVDVTSGLAFGRDLNTLEEKADPIQKHLDKIFPAVARRLTAPFPYWRYLPLPADREVSDAVAEVGKLIDTLIAQTRERLVAMPELRASPGNLLEALVAAQAKGEEGPSDEEISANVMTMLLAGEDTTANSLSYMMHFLMEYPHVQAADVVPEFRHRIKIE
jgi:cytochrome P450